MFCPDYHCEVVYPGPSLAGTCGGGATLLFMIALEHFLQTQCDVYDPCQAVVPVSVPDQEYDFVVVGGGSAGSVVASRLSEVKGWKVLLVEAGTNEPAGSQIPSLGFNFIRSSIDWQYYTEPEDRACRSSPEHRCFWPRGKVIGGTSVLFGMLYVRGSRKEYDDWEKQGNPGWSYKDVLPYFLKSEDNLQVDKMDKGYHSTGGMLPVGQFPYRPPLADAILEGATELGQTVGDVNGVNHTRFTIIQTTSKNGVRYSAAKAFLRPALKRPNLHVMLRTTVARVLIDRRNRHAYGVEVITPDGQRATVRAKREIVMSGGTINSPQVLLLSGVGPKYVLANANVPIVHHLPGVGRNLQNHVGYNLNFHIDEPDLPLLNWSVASKYLQNRDGPMSSNGLTQVVGLFNSKFNHYKHDNPDLQLLFFKGYLANCPKYGTVLNPHAPCHNERPARKVVTILPEILHPKSKGYLTLNDNHPLSHPKIFAKYFTNRSDVDTLLDGIRFAIKLSKTNALQKYGFSLDTTPAKGCEEMKFGSDEYWECALSSDTNPENHQVGTCKMGPATDELAVVDHELRVHGMTGLRVADASVMPATTSGNPYATVIMIAEKASDMIKQTWLGNNDGF